MRNSVIFGICFVFISFCFLIYDMNHISNKIYEDCLKQNNFCLYEDKTCDEIVSDFINICYIFTFIIFPMNMILILVFLILDSRSNFYFSYFLSMLIYIIFYIAFVGNINLSKFTPNDKLFKNQIKNDINLCINTNFKICDNIKTVCQLLPNCLPDDICKYLI